MEWRTLPRWLLAMHTYSPASSSDTPTTSSVLLKFSNFTFLSGMSPPFLYHLMVGVGLQTEHTDHMTRTLTLTGWTGTDRMDVLVKLVCVCVCSQSRCDTLQQQLLSSQHHLGALTSFGRQQRGHGLGQFPACGAEPGCS